MISGNLEKGKFSDETVRTKRLHKMFVRRAEREGKDVVLHVPRLGNSSPKGFVGCRTSTWVQVQIGHSSVRSPSRALTTGSP